MLKSLFIENYALIDKLQISFSGGLSIITGETGAGKSILLGALSLILGQRSDVSVLKNETKNCIVEGEFEIEGYGLESFFAENEIEYLPTTTIRRVMATGGKSRAFINDYPVTLNVLKELSEHLIDIHSQHQNLLLNSSAFQMMVLDAKANHQTILQDYRENLTNYKSAQTKLQDLQDKASRTKSDYDYLQFQFNELSALQLKSGEQQALEEELKQLTHAEEIKIALCRCANLLQDDELATDNLLREATQSLHKISNFWSAASILAERINSCRIELRDVADEITSENEKIIADTNRLELVSNRLNTIYSLQQKHHVDTVEALLELQERFETDLQIIANFDNQIADLKKQCEHYFQFVQKFALQLSEKRKKIAPEVEQSVTAMLRLLGMPHAVFTISITAAEQYSNSGNDVVKFLFSANKEMAPQELSRVASGGEMSRLMLCLKSLLVKNSGLPTIIFDEIDMGVSGEVADKMGAIIYELSKNMQVINITHLPQIASKGNSHFVVYKEIESTGTTATHIKLLTSEERVMEIAKMLSGQNVTEAAIANARELLK